MEFFEAVEKRCSYRGEFTGQDIPKEDLDKIMMAGVMAPSGYNHQTTSYIVVTRADIRKKMAEIYPRPDVNTASAIIVPLSELWVAENGLSFELEDYAASVENVLLAATSLGYAACWIDGAMKLEKRREKFESLLNIPEGRTIRAIIPVGIPKEPQKAVQREKKPLEERVTYID